MLRQVLHTGCVSGEKKITEHHVCIKKYMYDDMMIRASFLVSSSFGISV